MTNATGPSNPAAPDVPLAVWPVGQITAQYQRSGRYLAECSKHPAKMLPSLTRRIVEEYSKPENLVVDPMCGIGTSLVEAADLGRRAIGIEAEDRWARLAERNLRHVLGRKRIPAEVRTGDARALEHVLTDVSGTVDLVCTSPPYGCDTGNLDKSRWGQGGGLCPTTERNYSTSSRANLGHARGHAYEAAMAQIYAGCLEVLRPGGFLVVVTKNTRRKGEVFDLAGTTVAIARSAGFTYLQHVVALHAGVRDGALVARPSFWQRNAVTRARDRGEPAHLVVHEDVSVLRKPTSKEPAHVH